MIFYCEKHKTTTTRCASNSVVDDIKSKNVIKKNIFCIEIFNFELGEERRRQVCYVNESDFNLYHTYAKTAPHKAALQFLNGQNLDKSDHVLVGKSRALKQLNDGIFIQKSKNSGRLSSFCKDCLNEYIVKL
ncbi:hypothetical protein [Bartonella sp. HY406]|uniref:hypothetical protein n=1 Tax=Bartonella sp. HY406 TaxID=2979331 RepID=UPI0021CA572E|nr:hypothetical protein [Bartonella sp. HY406]UXN02412.1 hypothetical protein N6B01_07865 [Bartonella sp. HY406]